MEMNTASAAQAGAESAGILRNEEAPHVLQAGGEAGAMSEELHVIPDLATLYSDDEAVCGVCLEKPAVGSYVEVWCCGNVLCVNDAQQLGRCPFCRQEPLAWSIER